MTGRLGSHHPSDLAGHILRLLRAYEGIAVARRMRLGINANEDAVLLLLASGVRAPSEIAHAIGMTSAGITNLVDRLEAAGLVRREPHRTDKRRVLLMLTKRGYAAHLQLEELADALAAMTSHDEPVERFLHAAADHLETHAADGRG